MSGVVSTEAIVKDYSGDEPNPDQAMQVLKKEKELGGFIKNPKEKEESEIIEVKNYFKASPKVAKDGKKFEFKDKNGQGQGYCYVLQDVNGRELTVTTFVEHAAIRDALAARESFKGVKIKIYHPERSVYTVEVIE